MLNIRVSQRLQRLADGYRWASRHMCRQGSTAVSRGSLKQITQSSAQFLWDSRTGPFWLGKNHAIILFAFSNIQFLWEGSFKSPSQRSVQPIQQSQILCKANLIILTYLHSGQIMLFELRNTQELPPGSHPFFPIYGKNASLRLQSPRVPSSQSGHPSSMALGVLIR